jgi:hypothetical protein
MAEANLNNDKHVFVNPTMLDEMCLKLHVIETCTMFVHVLKWMHWTILSLPTFYMVSPP